MALLTALLFCAGAWAATRIVARDNCNSGPNYCTVQEAIYAASNGDTIAVFPTTATAAYYESITVTKQVTLIGKKANGTDAWTTGQAGALSGGPVLSITNTAAFANRPIVEFVTNTVAMKGFHVRSLGAAISATALKTSFITISYCDYSLDEGDKGIAVDYGATAGNIDVSYSRFTGQTTRTSNWFIVGPGSTSLNDGGSVDTANLRYNQITNTMSTLSLDRSIKNVFYSNNKFNNAWDTTAGGWSAGPYGYILITEPVNQPTTPIIQGITITHNTFNNSTGTASDEFAVLIDNSIKDADAGNWETNFALHANNFLQTYDGASYPIVGFQNAGTPNTSLSATYNWWNSVTISGKPKKYNDGSDSRTVATYSDKVGFDPWIQSQVQNGSYAAVAADTTLRITDTLGMMAIAVKTGSSGAASLITSQYISNPTGTNLTPTFSSSDNSGRGGGFFSIQPKTGIANIERITATLYYPQGTSISNVRQAHWHNGAGWITASNQAITQTAQTVTNGTVTKTFGGKVEVYIDDLPFQTTPTVGFLKWPLFSLSNTTSSTTTTIVLAGDKTVCSSGCDYTSLQTAVAVASDGDTLFIKGPTEYQGPRITKKITLKGLTSGGANAWTSGTAGAASGAPTIVYDGTNDPIINIASDNVELKGFAVSTHSAAVSATAFSGNINYVSVTYCDFNLGGGDKGIAVDYNNAVNKLVIKHNRFIGQPTNTSDWFTVSAGSAATVSDGGSANMVNCAYNQITNTMAAILLDSNTKNIHFSNNWFGNTWDRTDGTWSNTLHNPYYGYLLINKPDSSSGAISGITLTHNTFNNSSGTAPDEFTLLVTNLIDNGDAGQWNTNLALHANNILQTVDSLSYPIVGFMTPAAHPTAITAAYNYWANAPSAPANPGHVSDKVDVSPWLYTKTKGGKYEKIAANTVKMITDTLHNMTVEVDTTGSSGGATMIAT
ncbi:MAG: hypothetical protein GY868_18990, partial [Deltaproteobacteria bacterium]|nr:hypothetical protein [Deltaproteobacteria bacterium]